MIVIRNTIYKGFLIEVESKALSSDIDWKYNIFHLDKYGEKTKLILSDSGKSYIVCEFLFELAKERIDTFNTSS